MPDDKKRDDDVPFHLPIEPGYEQNDDDASEDIHKLDTEPLEPAADSQEMTAPHAGEKASSDGEPNTAEIARLHASDPPLEKPAKADSSGAESANEYTMDMDVPFRLPRDRGDDEATDDSPVSKWATMPNPRAGSAPPPADQTMAGNRQERAPATVQNIPPVRQSAQDARYQRPTTPPQRPAIPAAPAKSRPQARDGAKVLPPRRKSKGIGCTTIFVALLLTFCGGMTLITGITSAIAYVRIDQLLGERVAQLERYENFQSTFIYDRAGRPLFEVFDEGRRTNVPLEDVPQHLIDATLAIEDDGFYSNIGVDIPATTVAFLAFVGADSGEQTPGGSTITQQLVRNVLFEPAYRAERSPQRKIEEIALAIALTARRSKDDILEMYLNEIYYGNLAYGVQAASRIYFDKDVNDLTLAEAALLAGLPQAPAELDPFSTDPLVQEAVRRRWVRVLDEMVKDGFTTQAERDAAYAQGYALRPDPYIDLRAPHFTVYAQNELRGLMRELGYGEEEFARGGLKVFTTVDLELHEQTQRIAAQQINSMSAAQNMSNAAVLVLKPMTGEIMAMVGSIDYNNDAIDGRVNVTNRLRQPGSTVKPFTYSAALELGMTPGDVIWDTRVTISEAGQPPYIPRNYDGSVHGPMRMRYALANSYNIPAVQTVRYVGVDYFLHLMRRFGVQSLGLDASRFGISLTLGGGEMTLIELTRGFAVFANQGALVPTTSILCVLGPDNNIIYEYENGCPATYERRPVNRTAETVSRRGLGESVLDPRIAFLMTDMLSDNPSRTPAFGANSPLRMDNIPAAVKTGTTDQVRDNWTVGYTSNVAVGVWVGNNDGRPMQNTSGVAGAAPIWNQTMNAIYGNDNFMRHFRVDGQLLPDRPAPPPGMSQRQICDVRSLYDPATDCPRRITEWFLDSPAALPDGTGRLVAQSEPPRPADVVPQTGTYVQEVEPGVYRTVAMPLNPAIAQAITFQVAPGETAPPPPRYCRVPIEAIGMEGVNAQELLFIAPPLFPSDAAEAERFAQARGLAFLPSIDCTLELLTGGGLAPSGPAVVTTLITSPAQGEIVNGAMPIMGTAQFTPEQAWFYKVEIIGGQFNNWTDIQDVRYDSVVNGQLGTLPVLPPGNYGLRLVMIGNDGNLLQPPYEIAITVQ
ncbi:MAG: hypothetical protein EA396_11580 [Anaerolineaceae bacterium]|nr:MAG: hypothetical protein EA396_11580 [Anaerolineaceae bacterium]